MTYGPCSSAASLVNFYHTLRRENLTSHPIENISSKFLYDFFIVR